MTLDLGEASLLFSGGGEGDARAANAALRECIASVDPARLQPPPALTSEQLQAWYAYRIGQVDCLRGAGYSVPEAPPEQVFIDTAGAWDPFEALFQAGVKANQADVALCQQLNGKPGFLTW